MGVEGLKKPLNLVIKTVLIMRLVSVVLAEEIGKGYPVAFDERQYHMIQEGLAVLRVLILRIKTH